MNVVEIARALGPIDAKSIRRDPLLRWLVFYPLLLAAGIRWGMPIVTAHLETRLGFDLRPYHALLMSFIMLMTPMLAGIVIGFLLLDQRDDQTLLALQVTPLTLKGYFAYRIAVPTALSFVVTMFMFPVTGLVDLNAWMLAAAAGGVSLLAPLYALFLGSFAGNKIQGFALAKALGILLVPPLIAYFVKMPWQILFGIDPLYWPARFLWTVGAGESALKYLLAGIVFQALLLRLLMRRFNR